MFPFYTPENIRKSRFTGVFRGYKTGTLARNGLIERLKAMQFLKSCAKYLEIT